jgi:hypothetical protein
MGRWQQPVGVAHRGTTYLEGAEIPGKMGCGSFPEHDSLSRTAFRERAFAPPSLPSASKLVCSAIPIAICSSAFRQPRSSAEIPSRYSQNARSVFFLSSSKESRGAPIQQSRLILWGFPKSGFSPFSVISILLVVRLGREFIQLSVNAVAARAAMASRRRIGPVAGLTFRSLPVARQ